MKISGKHNADIVGFSIKRNKSHDGREAAVDLEISIKQEEALSKFGEDFEKLAFATMRVIKADIGDTDDVDSIAFLVDNVKPGHRVVFERHRIALEEEVFEEQPEFLTIRTIDGEPRVIAKLRVPIDVGRTTLITSLAQKVGQTVKIEFEPKQAVLEFKKKNGKANDAAEAPASA